MTFTIAHTRISSIDCGRTAFTP